jgi:2-(1,2-epoxy-1,2-dihydrophenyl)acetyl-CoA isomerase
MSGVASPNASVRVTVADAIARVTVDRPDAMNTINEEVAAALHQIFAAIGGAPEIRAVVLEGAGKHFMAGGDVKAFHGMLSAEPDRSGRRHYFEGLLATVHRAVSAMRAAPQPIVAKVRGAVAGGGIGVMLACDLVVASDDAVFNLAYCHLGTSPDCGTTYQLPRVAGMKRAMELALLGERFDAEKAERWGLVNRVVPTAKLDGAVDALAARLAAGPARAYAHTKAMLNRSLGGGLAEHLDAEARGFAECSTTDDFAEGVDAFVAKRKPEFTGT